jgi:hypothetical protein
MNVPVLAAGAATGARPSLSVGEDMSAVHAGKGKRYQLLSLAGEGACNVRKVVVDFAFPDPELLGNLAGGHLPIHQQADYFLAHRSHGWLPFSPLRTHPEPGLKPYVKA